MQISRWIALCPPPLPSSHLAIMVLPFSSATLDYQVQGWDPGVEVAWVLSNPLLDSQQQNPAEQ